MPSRAAGPRSRGGVLAVVLPRLRRIGVGTAPWLVAAVAASCGRDDAARVMAPAAVTSDVAAADANVDANVDAKVDATLRTLLARNHFTGRVGSSIEARLGRPVNGTVANVGRLLWFDPITGLNDDNSCGGCHSPTNGFGDAQPIAIGIDNNGVVGPERRGPRNQRRTPMAINTAFYPALMWNGRFAARSGNAFDNHEGFQFPAPESRTLSYFTHLLQAQAFIPPTERVEVAGFHAPGNNADIRDSVIARLRASRGYGRLFANAFPDVAAGAPLSYDHFARAIAEFEFTLVFADAPLDRYARGDTRAMSDAQKRGAVLFFGRAGCVQCHAVAGQSNEMFSDFRNHVAGMPQVAPRHSNLVFDGPAANEDFGLEQVSGRAADRYAFRTAPLRNLALSPAFMHDGAFMRLEDAVRYHLDAAGQAPAYAERTQPFLPPDLRGPLGPSDGPLARLDERLRRRVVLSDEEFASLIAFLRGGLLDERARPEILRAMIPATLPSERAGFRFQFR